MGAGLALGARKGVLRGRPVWGFLCRRTKGMGLGGPTSGVEGGDGY